MHETDVETPCRIADCHAEATIVLVSLPERNGVPAHEAMRRACTNPGCRSNTGRSRPYERV